MRPRSKVTLNQMVSISAVLFSAATLICLTIVFVGCTSPFSPFDLYFMKVDLTDFPQISTLHARGSEELTGSDHSRALAQIGDASSGKLDQSLASDQVARSRRSHLDKLLTEVEGELPAYYHVGLLGYCQGGNGTITSCTSPGISFSFSLWTAFSTYAARLVAWLGNDKGSFLSGNVHHSYAITCLYITSFVTAFLSFAACITCVFSSKCGGLFLVFSAITTILLTVSTSWVIAFYNFYTQEVKQILGEYGARASLGTHSIASTCLAVTFSLASHLTFYSIFGVAVRLPSDALRTESERPALCWRKSSSALVSSKLAQLALYCNENILPTDSFLASFSWAAPLLF